MKSMHWNPWHGCTRLSEGCRNCYMYDIDSQYKRNSSKVTKTKAFDLPLRKNKHGYEINKEDLSNGFLYTCMTSDFFHKDADEWREDAWKIIKERKDLNFVIITKRIDRFGVNLPKDWGDGYENVYVGVSCETQAKIDERIPVLLDMPIKHKNILLAPLLEEVSIEKYIKSEKIEEVSVSGERLSIDKIKLARMLDYGWVLKIRDECIKNNTNFNFMQTGSCFVKDSKIYRIKQHRVQIEQAQKAGINFIRT